MQTQLPPVIWLTGLSGSGKTTIGQTLAARLRADGVRASVLDGDELRSNVSSDLGFSEPDRFENVRRAAHLARVMRNGGAVVICSLISPMITMRQMARDITGEPFIEVYVNCPIEVCAQRDVKGLYAKVTAGEIHDMTGIGSDYEPPADPDLEVRTDKMNVEECVKAIVESVNNRR